MCMHYFVCVCRCVNRLFDLSDSSLLLRYTSKLVAWLDRTPVSLVKKLTLAGFNKLSGALTQKCHWSGLITLYHSCPQHLLSLSPSQVCDALNVATVRLEPSVKLIETLGMLSNEELGGISPEVCYWCVSLM